MKFRVFVTRHEFIDNKTYIYKSVIFTRKKYSCISANTL